MLRPHKHSSEFASMLTETKTSENTNSVIIMDLKYMWQDTYYESATRPDESIQYVHTYTW